MKFTFVKVLLIVALIVSLIWMWVTNFDYEPIIAVITILIALAGVEVNQNKSRILGDRNRLLQKRGEGNNNANIEGDDNEIIQF